MNITHLELSTKDLHVQQKYYSTTLGLPVTLTSSDLEVKIGTTALLFEQASADFDGAYHFAFNIPKNQFRAAKAWISNRVPLLKNESGEDEFSSQSWNSSSVYFKDAAGNVLEFIARHSLNNAVEKDFNSRQILNISEIGLPSEDVISLANDLCSKLKISVFQQEPDPSFTPVGDDSGLLILPLKNRIWIPNSGVPAKLLPVKVKGETNGKPWEVRGYPYVIVT